MNRKEFLKYCGGSCLALAGIALFTQGCTATHYVQTNVKNNQLVIPKSEFSAIKNEKKTFRKFIIVKSDQSEYPIVVYRINDTAYNAMLMRCTHQGIELSVNGDILSCSAHGSEFSNTGEIIQGPADKKLKAFAVSSDDANIYIQLS